MGRSVDARGGGLDLIAAPFTALDQVGGANLRAVEGQVRELVDGGLRGAFVCGTTGEGASLSTSERVQVAERWCEAAGDELEVIVHVGHASLAEANALAEHAQSAGADGIAAVGPYYHKPGNTLELAGFCAEIANSAPETPFYYYHIPSITGLHFPMAEFLTVARERIPTLAGIKFTHDDLVDYGRCLDAAEDRYEIFFGRDEMLLAALSIGARSAVGTTYNFAAPLYTRMAEAFEAGDLAAARRAQSLARAMIDVAIEHGGLPAFKTMTSWAGVDCGPCRLPLSSLGADEQESLRAHLEHVGFLAGVRGAE